MKLIFCLQIDIKGFFKLIPSFQMCMYGQIYPNYPKYLKKLVSDEVNFLHTDKHERFLQIDTMICDGDKYSQFAISLEYLKKKVGDEVAFLRADKHQGFYKVVLSFLMKEARHVQSTQIGTW